MNQEQLPKPGEVLICSEKNHAGQQMLITADTIDLEQYFPVASFRLGPRTGVTLFSEKDYQGLSQELTAELASFDFSRLQGQTPKSLKIWSSAGKPFTGYWAIEVAEGRYLSVCADQDGVGVLATNSSVAEREAFSFQDLGAGGPGRRMVACNVRGAPFVKPAAARSGSALTIDDLARLTLVDEIEAGFRKFSLLTEDNRWICYGPEEDHFIASTEVEDRTIFCLSIKIAEDETQVGELFQGEAALFEHPGYWGKAWVFYTDYPDFGRVVNLNDEVSSIQLGPLTGATIYREPGYAAGEAKEGKQDITANLPALAAEQVGDNQISSIDLWRIVPPSGLGITIQCRLSQDFRGAGNTFEEYTAYRTTIRLPVTVESVDVWTTDQTRIEVEDQTYSVDEDHPVTLRPNLIQCLMITTDACAPSGDGAPEASLRAPGLKIRTNTMLPHERIVIYPDQEVHSRLANLKDDELWDAKIKNKDGSTKNLIEDRSDGKKLDVTNAQTMITKAMSTVRYDPVPSGGWSQAVSPTEELMNRGWKLDFLNYKVTATTLYVREGPGMSHKPIGYLRKNDIIKPVGFNTDGTWMRIHRLKDGLTGWSSVKYLDQIVVVPPQPGEERCRVTVEQLHVREGPGVEYRSLGVIKRDETVTILGVNSTVPWKQIRRSDGLTGWSSSRYLAPVQPALPQMRPQALAEAEGLPAALPLAALPARPLLEIPGLTPEVRFQDISLDDVQALLARAESPDTELAQGFFDSLIKAVKSAVSVVIAQVEKGVAIIVELADKVVKWVADTTHKIVAFVEGIIEKIGMVIKDIIDWLKFLFDWDDILHTRDILRGAIREALDYVSQTLVPQAKEPVERFFKRNKKLITQGLDSAIEALGGTVDTSAAPPTLGLSSIADGMMDAINWILSKVMGVGQGGIALVMDAVGIGGSSAPVDEVSEKLRRFTDETLTKGLQNVAVIPAGVEEVITTLAKNPDQPLLAVAALLKIFRTLALKMVDIAEDMVLGLLDLLTTLIEKIIGIVTENIRIPFISDILEWLGLPALTFGFSVLDAATLILAIPLTAVYKAFFHKPPFEDVPSLNLENRNVWRDLEVGFNIVGYISNTVNNTICIPLDVQPEIEGQKPTSLNATLEAVSLTCSLVSYIPSIYSLIEQLAAPEEDDPSRVERDVLYWVMFGIESLFLLLDSTSYAIDKERFKRWNKVTIVGVSIIGAAHLGLFIWKGIKDKDNVEEILPGVFMILPEICSCLRLSKNPYALGAFGIVDFAAAAASGAALWVYCQQVSEQSRLPVVSQAG